jgi:hypothetical protein
VSGSWCRRAQSPSLEMQGRCRGEARVTPSKMQMSMGATAEMQRRGMSFDSEPRGALLRRPVLIRIQQQTRVVHRVPPLPHPWPSRPPLLPPRPRCPAARRPNPLPSRGIPTIPPLTYAMEMKNWTLVHFVCVFYRYEQHIDHSWLLFC